jgi:hypothetical protein
MKMVRTIVGASRTPEKRGESSPPFYRERAFWKGFCSVFDISGSFNPLYYGRDPRRADYEALRADWEAIGRDMELALRRFEEEHAEEIEAAGQARLFDPNSADNGG